MYHKKFIYDDTLGFKRTFDEKRDVDQTSCLRLLMKFKANLDRTSINGTRPIFKAIKSSYQTLQVFLEYVADKTQAINALDNKGMTPLCKISGQQESEENFKKITLMLKLNATCARSLPDHHPMYIALRARNVKVVRALFKHSDAVQSLQQYIAKDPFLLALAKCNNDAIFEECLSEWTKWCKKKEPASLPYLNINIRNSEHLNILHVIAMNSSISQFKSLLSNCKHLNSSCDYTSEDILTLLNQSLS